MMHNLISNKPKVTVFAMTHVCADNIYMNASILVRTIKCEQLHLNLNFLDCRLLQAICGKMSCRTHIKFLNKAFQWYRKINAPYSVKKVIFFAFLARDGFISYPRKAVKRNLFSRLESEKDNKSESINQIQ